MKKPFPSGFTLVELMIAITLVAILMSIGVPSYRYVTNANRISAEVNGLLGDLQYARAEAIKEGQFVTACVSANGTSCLNSSDWKNGWIVFSDPNGNAALDAGENVMRTQISFKSTDTFQANNNLNAVVFNREGLATGVANGTLIKLHDATSNTRWTRCLSVGLVGLFTTLTYGGTANGVTCN